MGQLRAFALSGSTAVVTVAGWNYFQSKRVERVPVNDDESQATALMSESAPVSKEEAPAFRCDGRIYCSDMNSRAEAELFVKNCPGTKMDGDNDGEPCESDSRF